MAINPIKSGVGMTGYGAFAQPQAASWANPSTWADALSAHSNALLGLGGALLSGNLGSIGQAAAAGANADRSQKLQSMQLGLAAAQRQAADDYVVKLGHPELKGAFASVGDAIAANKPNVIAPGSTATSGFGDPINMGAAFDGSKNGAVNFLVRAQNDPSLRNTPDYAAAYAVATEPTMTPQGMMTPAFPPEWAPQQQPAAPAPTGAPPPQPSGYQPSPSDVAPIGAMAGAPQGGFSTINPATPPQLGPGVIPGTQPFNESQARVGFLSNSSVPDIKRVIDGFPALMSTKDQVLQGVSKFDPTGLTRAAQSPEYKQANDAMRSAMGNVLYFASGANLNAGELQRKIDAYVPAIGDDPQTSVNKLDRFANDVLSMAQSTKDPQIVQWAQQALADIQQTEKQILSGGVAAKPVVSLGNGVTIQEVP